MSAASQSRTRSFARVMGPFLLIVTWPSSCAIRAPSPEMGTDPRRTSSWNAALVWITGAWILFFGLLIIAFHQYWSSVSAVLISLFGWYMALRGIALLAAPDLYARAGAASMHHMLFVQIGFGVIVLIGVWLTFAIAGSPAAP